MFYMYGWMFIAVAAAHQLEFLQGDYFRVGPSPTLKFAGAHIDTWKKYWFLVGFRFITKAVETATFDMIGPWITTDIQDENRTDLPYPPWKCNMIITLYNQYMGIDKMLDTLSVFSQFDIVVVDWLSVFLAIQFWMLPKWTRGKQYHPPTRAGMITPQHNGNGLGLRRRRLCASEDHVDAESYDILLEDATAPVARVAAPSRGDDDAYADDHEAASVN
jgi:hypothetical protein